MRVTAGLIAFITFSTACAAGGPPDRVYVIERVGDRIAPDTEIGKKRAGLACLPNGRIRWSDIGGAGATDRRELVQDALEDAGLPIATLASATPLKRQIRLRGIVTEATVDLCAKRFLGHPNAFSGTGRLVIEWRGEVAGGDGLPLRHVSTIETSFEGPKAGSLGTIGRTLIEEATRDLAIWLQGGAAGAGGASGRK